MDDRLKKNDIVYYIGSGSHFRKNIPYLIFRTEPGKVYDLEIREMNQDNVVNKYGKSVDFVSEKEWLARNSLENFRKPEKEYKFQPNDIVYYNNNNDDTIFKKDYPYTLYLSSEPGILRIVDESSRLISLKREVIDDKFISKKEYISKYASPIHTTGSFDQFLNNMSKRYLKTGDIVYYVSDKIKNLKNDIPYIISYVNPNSGYLMIDSNFYPSNDFISQDDYEKLKILNIDVENFRDDIPKNEIQIKAKIYKDTKNGILKWFKPYQYAKDWYRSILILNKPTDAYLRFDLTSISDNKWRLNIYYHRSKKGPNINITPLDNPVMVHEFIGSSMVRNLSSLVANILNDDKK